MKILKNSISETGQKATGLSLLYLALFLLLLSVVVPSALVLLIKALSSW